MIWYVVTAFCVIAVDMTFTRKNVLRAVWEVKDVDLLGDCLGVPWSKRDEIKRQFSNDSQSRKKAYINYVMDHDPAASWRRIIVALDGMKQKEAADKICALAEPLTGKSRSHTLITKKLLDTHTISLTVSLTYSLTLHSTPFPLPLQTPHSISTTCVWL